MKRALILTLMIVLVSAVGSAVAQNDYPSGDTRANTPSTNMGTASTVAGKVVSSDSTMLIVQTDAGNQMTFVVDTDSDVPTTLTPGDRITVRYHNLDGGRYHAANVTMATTPGNRATGTYNDTDNTLTANNNRNETLPRTASALPLVALLGVLSLGAGLGLRAASRFARS